MKHKKVEIPVHGLFSKAECLWFLNRGFDDCMYSIYEDRVRRAFQSDRGIMVVDIYLMPDKLVLKWLNHAPSAADIKAVVRFVSEWFDLSTDLSLFYKAVVADERIAYMSKAFSGLRFIGMPDLFEALAWCIIGQQIHLSFAYTIKRRLVEQYGTFTTYGDQRYYIFPTAETLADANISDLRALQFSEKKAQYLVTIAQAFTNGALSKKFLQELPDPEHRIQFLTRIRGIGQWTANYALMKSLKEPTCIPHGDAGLLNALVNHNIIKTKGDKQAIDAFFRTFNGWQSYMVFYLWRTLSQPKS